MITFNGISSDSKGVIVQRYPNRTIPKRRIFVNEVAGKNGGILTVDKTFPNVVQEYEVYLSAASVGLPSVARAVAEWLTSPTDYVSLWDSYESDVYREAVLEQGFDIENSLNKYGHGTIAFNCKPQKFLTSGTSPITPVDGYVTNPTAYDAQPIITVSGSGEMTINGRTIEILDTVSDFVINCETMEADSNTLIYCLDFPVLSSGANEVTLASTITSFSMIPRWWTL